MSGEQAATFVVRDRSTLRYWNMSRAKWGVEHIREAQRFRECDVRHLMGQDGLEVIPVG